MTREEIANLEEKTAALDKAIEELTISSDRVESWLDRLELAKAED